MKKRLNLLVAITMVLALVLTACSGSGSGKATNDPGTGKATDAPATVAPPTNEPAKELEGHLEIWTFDDGGTKVLADAFMANNPKVTINITNPGWNELPENLATTIAAGKGAPDVAYIEGSMFNRFAAGDGLEDLLQPPYDAGKHKADFSESNWDRWHSLDGKKLIGMPWDMPPMVTFYRPDLIEAAGGPSDPAELAEYMKDADNVFKLGQALKANGVFLFENDNTPIGLFTGGTGYFDRDFNYLRNNDDFVKAFDMAKQVKQLGLAMNTCAFWCDDGKALASSGKLAMVFYGPWAMNNIKELGEDQLGKWRATALPFGLSAPNGGSTMVIPSQGQNKELAYAFVEWALASVEGNEVWIGNGGSPGYLPAWEGDFGAVTYELLGDQPANELFKELMKQVETAWVPFPFNSAISDNVWNAKIDEALAKNMDAKAALQQIQEEVEKTFKVDIDAVKAQVGK